MSGRHQSIAIILAAYAHSASIISYMHEFKGSLDTYLQLQGLQTSKVASMAIIIGNLCAGRTREGGSSRHRGWTAT